MPTNDLSPAAEVFLVRWESGERVNPLVMRADLAALLETARAEAVPRWTACAEGLPEEGVPVLLWLAHERYIVARLDHSLPQAPSWRNCEGGWYPLKMGIHWQPLPPPPVP